MRKEHKKKREMERKNNQTKKIEKERKKRVSEILAGC